ncbi:hypothetical protein E4T42_04079 [Aureobasidium subglaciale]|nr:hypothetical protein E4T42_04079 [Aureobasidium subglaciale]
MTSAATEREFKKWRLWGVNKFLEANAALGMEQVDNGRPPTLDLVQSRYFKDKDEADELLTEARSSLREMELKDVILGACDFLDIFPLRTSEENGNVLLTHRNVYRTFGKKEAQGMRLYAEARHAYLRFRRVRDINKLSISQFTEDYLSTNLLMYEYPGGSSEQGLFSTTEVGVSAFDIKLTTSADLSDQADGETTKSTEPSNNVLHTLFELIKHTSYKHYDASNQGWDAENKLEEMKDEDMRYLIVRLAHDAVPESDTRWSKDSSMDHSVVGFLSFMITQEEKENVVYIYEIHMSEHFRGCGLGRHLFNVVEHVGRTTAMDKSMLTVFKSNTRARNWYASRGYEVDEISPKPRKLRGGRSIESDYEILSKHLHDKSNKKNKH